MSKVRLFLASCVVAIGALVPVSAAATTSNNESATYDLVMEANQATSAGGDTASLTGEGEFGVHPKSFEGGGNFTLTHNGTTMSGTWTATGLLAFQPYGCGIVFDITLPPSFCGGMVLGRILLTPSAGPQMEAVLRVVCIIGDPPSPYVGKNATECINLNIPGVENYNKQTGGDNLFIRTS